MIEPILGTDKTEDKTQFQKQFFLTNEIIIFRNLKTENLYVLLKAKDIAVSVLTVYLIFQVVKNFPKLFIYLGVVLNGAPGNNCCGISTL